MSSLFKKCLGLFGIAAMGILVARQIATGQTQTESWCVTQYCSELPSIPFDSCPLKAPCEFKNSAGEALWCTYDPNEECTLKNPIESASCKGYCVLSPTITCTWERNVCK